MESQTQERADQRQASMRYSYPLAKFLVSFWLVPLIQISAFILTRRSREQDRKTAVIVTSRSNQVSPSFVCLIPELRRQSVTVILHSTNYAKVGALEKIHRIFSYFSASQGADFVFLDDTFLPVSYALKSRFLPQPVIVQLWHSAGLFKKVGLDVCDGVLLRSLMRINFRNFDLVAVSAEACRDAIAGFMGIKKAQVVTLGTSYTDRYFPVSNASEAKPVSLARKRVVYAPTFRGDAFNVMPSPIPQVQMAYKNLELDFDCFISPHPHEKLELGDHAYPFVVSDTLPEIDVLITDYSSIAMDYLLANPGGKLVLFVPDLELYMKMNGFYVSPEEVTPHIVHDYAALVEMVRSVDRLDHTAYSETYLTHCDGRATARLLSYLGLEST